MNIGNFTTPNEKGQIVIPKEIRDRLGINENITLNITISGNGIHIYPVSNFITNADKESSYLKLLEKTKGKWGTSKGDSSKKRKSQIELEASIKRKKSW